MIAWRGKPLLYEVSGDADTESTAATHLALLSVYEMGCRTYGRLSPRPVSVRRRRAMFGTPVLGCGNDIALPLCAVTRDTKKQPQGAALLGDLYLDDDAYRVTVLGLRIRISLTSALGDGIKQRQLLPDVEENEAIVNGTGGQGFLEGVVIIESARELHVS